LTIWIIQAKKKAQAAAKKATQAEEEPEKPGKFIEFGILQILAH
jgi:hypothetical protein